MNLARNLISDDEWTFFEGFIRAVRHPNGRKPADHRLVLDGVFWIARTGAPWRDLPEEFGKWSSVYRQFRRWTLAGLWEDILDALNHAGIAPDKLQMVDSTVIRAHHHAAGAKRGTPKEAHDTMRKNRKVRKVVDMAIYTLRNMAERCFNKLKNSRRLATRYDKTAESFLGFVDVACIRLWLRHLSTRPSDISTGVTHSDAPVQFLYYHAIELYLSRFSG